MNSESIIDFIYTLVNADVKIWAESGKVRLSVPKDVTLSEDKKIFIELNKAEILSCLENNQVYSQDYDILMLHNETNSAVLSFAQERLWFIEKYEDGTNAYNVPIVLKLSSDIRLDILESSIKSIVLRHEILHTLIKIDENGKGHQVVADIDTYPLNYSTVKIKSHEELNQALINQSKYLYNLTTEYPIRVSIYEVSNSPITTDKEFYLCIVIHHIAFDGWSTDLLLKELYQYYNYYLNNTLGLDTRLALPNLTLQYKDFAIWQKHYLTGERLERQLHYWKNKLIDYETLNLVIDMDRPNNIDYHGKNIYFELDQEISSNLRELSKKLKVSLFSLLLAGYYLMLRAYSNQDDIVIGTPIANRHYTEIEDLIGCFVNSLALRVKINSQSSITEFIQKIGQEVVEAQLHQDLPFEKLVEELNIEKDTSRHPIFQVMFGLQNFGRELCNDIDYAQCNSSVNLCSHYTGCDDLYDVAQFDISTFIDDSSVCLKGCFNYATSLYNDDTIRGFIETYIVVLHQIVKLSNDSEEQLTKKILDLEYVGVKKYQQIINIWNDTEKEFVFDKTVNQLFEEQVAKTPDKIAVVYNDIRLTYQDLNDRANKLAYYLKNHYNIAPETFIALCLDRSEHMLIGILAVLKAGGVYVPIDPCYPDDRIKYIIENTDIRLVLTQKVHQQKLERIICSVDVTLAMSSNNLKDPFAGKSEVLVLDEKSVQEKLSLELTSNLNTIIISTNLAYVIYTSGTTGNPHGVMVAHQGVVNLKNDLTSRYQLGNKKDSEVILQFANYVFDASIEQIALSLLNGYVLLLIPNKLWQNKKEFYNYLNIHKVTHIHATPTFLEQYDFSKLRSLKRLIFGGELLTKENYNKVKLDQSINVVNEYGPTETSVTSIVNIIQNSDVSIGKPIDNTKVYVLNDNLEPVPVGAVGELYIGGVGLARGYLNRPDLTAERFIANPFYTENEELDKKCDNNRKSTRLYKTGDLVRWGPDGNLEYIGRNDFQIKIRGHRIELGEIESILASYDGIKQNVVLAREHINKEDKSKYLVGYYVSDSKRDEEDIMEYLRSRLPEHMVPSILVHLDSLPLTINGKLDRKALPNPEFGGDSNSYAAPRSELESKICEIWSEVLGLAVDKVSINDSFFRLGGDSIISIQLVSRLRQRLGVKVSVKDIFSYKTIERLYDNVIIKFLNASGGKETNLLTEQGILSGEVPLLAIQRWFFDNELEVPHHWNQSFVVKTPNLDVNRLQEAVSKLIGHHDGFRLRYKKGESIASLSSPYIQYYDNTAIAEELKILDIRCLTHQEGSKEFDLELQEVLTQWQSSFDIEHGPLYGVGYIYGYSDGSSRVWFALHHLIVDGVSCRILMQDLRDCYDHKDLGIKGTSYRQWVNVLQEYTIANDDEKDYWINIISDYNNQSNKLVFENARASHAQIFLTEEQTSLLLKDTNKAYNTEVNDILLTALGYALQDITGNGVNYIVLEGHGREEIDDKLDISRTLGWFTSMYPVRLEVRESLGESIKNVKETLRQIPNKGIGYGALIGYERDTLPRISFNYLGQFDKKDQLDSAETNVWKIVSENSGTSADSKNQDHNIININGMVIDGKLHFSIMTKLNEDVTNKLSELLKCELEKIIAHCIDQEVVEYSMSDFKDFEPYIILNKTIKENSRRLFILPPGDGGAESYLNNIVLKLHDKNLVLFNNYYLYLNNKFGADKVENITYEKLANEYITYIKSIQPQGPYNLFGWSFGGILAFEIARQLIDTNNNVSNIMLIDTCFNYKKAALATDTSLSHTNNINYKYCPSLDSRLFHANVVLFKALKIEDSSFIKDSVDTKLENMYKIGQYYVENTYANHLDDLLDHKKFKIKTMNDTHESWVSNETQIIKICNELGKW